MSLRPGGRHRRQAAGACQVLPNDNRIILRRVGGLDGVTGQDGDAQKKYKADTAVTNSRSMHRNHRFVGVQASACAV